MLAFFALTAGIFPVLPARRADDAALCSEAKGFALLSKVKEIPAAIFP